jgi:poly-gamma-glutamate capsule biosynthesis protein CapA/YwtB (metallophosphatase superfamily)
MFPKNKLFLAFLVFLAFLIYETSYVQNSRIFGAKSEDKEVSVLLAGDVMLGRTVMTTSLNKSDPTYPFQKVADILKNSDIVFVNLEAPFVENCPRTSGGLKFCSDPKMISGLKYANINVVNLANNHILNYGQIGLETTKELLAKNDILFTGLGDLVTMKVKNLTIGFLGFDYLDNKPTASDYQLVKDSKAKVDILMVGVHWGVEYTDQATNTQRQIAKSLIDSGADVVVGHHPHWIQGVEYIADKPVYYSLGNFVFDQMWSEKTKEGLVVKLTFNEKGAIKKEELHKIYMNSWAQPEFIN